MNRSQFIHIINVTNTRQNIRNCISDIDYIIRNIRCSDLLTEDEINDNISNLHVSLKYLRLVEKPFDKCLETIYDNLESD
jgi:hypothetical protein